MVESSKISIQKGFKRVLIYCSSHRQLEEIISTLPIIDGYWDAFDNLKDAIKAVKAGDYVLLRNAN